MAAVPDGGGLAAAGQREDDDRREREGEGDDPPAPALGGGGRWKDSLVLVALDVGTRTSQEDAAWQAPAIALVFGLVHGLGFAGADSKGEPGATP